jgi:hypothetical protein
MREQILLVQLINIGSSSFGGAILAVSSFMFFFLW